jgi:hypothetical protein
MTEHTHDASPTRQPRRPRADHWLLEAFQRLGHPAVERLAGIRADSAWEALEQAGATAAQRWRWPQPTRCSRIWSRPSSSRPAYGFMSAWPAGAA